MIRINKTIRHNPDKCRLFLWLIHWINSRWNDGWMWRWEDIVVYDSPDAFLLHHHLSGHHHHQHRHHHHPEHHQMRWTSPSLATLVISDGLLWWFFSSPQVMMMQQQTWRKAKHMSHQNIHQSLWPPIQSFTHSIHYSIILSLPSTLFLLPWETIFSLSRQNFVSLPSLSVSSFSSGCVTFYFATHPHMCLMCAKRRMGNTWKKGKEHENRVSWLLCVSCCSWDFNLVEVFRWYTFYLFSPDLSFSFHSPELRLVTDPILVILNIITLS